MEDARRLVCPLRAIRDVVGHADVAPLEETRRQMLPERSREPLASFRGRLGTGEMRLAREWLLDCKRCRRPELVVNDVRFMCDTPTWAAADVVVVVVGTAILLLLPLEKKQRMCWSFRGL